MMKDRRGFAPLIPLIASLASAGVLVPVLIILGIVLAVLLFGIPTFLTIIIGVFTSPIKTIGILLLILAAAWLLITRNFTTAAIIGAVGLLLLLGSNLGFLAAYGVSVSGPDKVVAVDASTMAFRGNFTVPQGLGRQGDYWQFPMGYTGELTAPMIAACCGANGPKPNTIRIQYVGGALDGLVKEHVIPVDARNLWQEDTPIPPTGFVKFFKYSGAGGHCPTSYYYEVNFAPLVPVGAGSVVDYELLFSCRDPHGIALPDLSSRTKEAVRTISGGPGLWQRFLTWLRGVFA